MDDRIMTLHPETGKQGVNISRAKYDAIRGASVAALQAHGELTFKALMDAVRERLEASFEGSISWYVTTVKLDLEARGVITRVPRSKPQRLRLAGEG